MERRGRPRRAEVLTPLAAVPLHDLAAAAAIVLLVVAALAFTLRAIAARSARAAAVRWPVGASGIIPGAEAIALDGDGSGAVVLLHGFGDTPRSLAALAAALHADGYTVRVPLLPGHGGTLAGFAASDARDWMDAARDAWDGVQPLARRRAIGGLSLGGALAAIVAADQPAPDALVLLAPYVGAPRLVRWVARGAAAVGAVAPYLPADDVRSIHDPEARATSIGFGVTTPSLVRELVSVADRARASLPRITAPTLYVQSRSDNRIPAAVASAAFRALGTPVKRLVWLEQGGHVITVDRGNAELSALVLTWLDEQLGVVRHPSPGVPQIR